MPSLNTGNAILSNPIKVDSSYNVGIGGAASGSFKLQVTGTTNLTGALTGTSGTFSSLTNGSILKAGASGIISNTSFITETGTGVGFQIANPLSLLHMNGQSGTAGLPSLLLYGEAPSNGQRYGFNVSADQLDISALGTSASIGFYTGGNASSITRRLLISSTGAATFSSDIQGGGDLYFNKATRTTIYPTTTNQNLHIKSNGSGVLQLNNDNTGNLTMCVGGGNVGIGFSNVTSKLQVAGEITTYAGTNTDFYAYMNYLGTTYNFGPGEATDNVDFKIAGGGTFTTGGGFRWFTQSGGTTPTERMRITSGGQVQIKQPADGFTEGLRWINTLGNRWTFVTGGDNNFYIGFNEASRGIFNSSTGVYTAQSDKNKKKDFEQSTIGLNAVLGLKPTLYRMKDDDELVEKHLGFIAQEVKEFIPQAYSESTNGDNTFIGLTEMPIIAALVKAVQEQQAQIEELKALINK